MHVCMYAHTDNLRTGLLCKIKLNEFLMLNCFMKCLSLVQAKLWFLCQPKKKKKTHDFYTVRGSLKPYQGIRTLLNDPNLLQGTLDVLFKRHSHGFRTWWLFDLQIFRKPCMSLCVLYCCGGVTIWCNFTSFLPILLKLFSVDVSGSVYHQSDLIFFFH